MNIEIDVEQFARDIKAGKRKRIGKNWGQG